MGRSLPLKTSSHGNTNSPTASTETTAETERVRRKGGEGTDRDRLHITEHTSANTTLQKYGFTLRQQKRTKKKLSIQEESIPPKDTKQRGRYLENWLRFSHSSLSVNTVYNVYKITAQVMNGTQWASQSGVSSG